MKNSKFIKIVYSTDAEPTQSITLEDYMKGNKRMDNCFTLCIDADKAEETIEELVAEGNVIVSTEAMEA